MAENRGFGAAKIRAETRNLVVPGEVSAAFARENG